MAGPPVVAIACLTYVSLSGRGGRGGTAPWPLSDDPHGLVSAASGWPGRMRYAWVMQHRKARVRPRPWDGKAAPVWCPGCSVRASRASVVWAGAWQLDARGAFALGMARGHEPTFVQCKALRNGLEVALLPTLERASSSMPLRWLRSQPTNRPGCERPPRGSERHPRTIPTQPPARVALVGRRINSLLRSLYDNGRQVCVGARGPESFARNRPPSTA